jgi:ATP-binding cassette subfamily B (MDR/TAP) protein 1
MIISYFQVTFWIIPGEKQTRVMRKKLFNSILKQEIGWFDVYKTDELTNRLSE